MTLHIGHGREKGRVGQIQKVLKGQSHQDFVTEYRAREEMKDEQHSELGGNK